MFFEMSGLPEYLSSLHVEEAVLKGRQRESLWSFILLDEKAGARETVVCIISSKAS